MLNYCISSKGNDNRLLIFPLSNKQSLNTPVTYCMYREHIYVYKNHLDNALTLIPHITCQKKKILRYHLIKFTQFRVPASSYNNKNQIRVDFWSSCGNLTKNIFDQPTLIRCHMKAIHPISLNRSVKCS